MPFLTAAVALIGALCLFNLLLIFAVLRRLREHTAELARLQEQRQAGPALYDPTVLVGRMLPELPVGADERPELVGFFDAACDACHKHAPEFAAAAKRHAAAAVVTGKGQDADDLADLLADVPTVLVGADAVAVTAALGLEAFPTFLHVGLDGTILRAQLTVPEGLVAAAKA
ncbi:hypothetical protein V6V47_12780 [Micromonospora sp. CPCC 205539]|uniref:hypothetical protein n=1 Tax=Micromonospora sp. CPCC 205539 TaxID=3122408 RepID=UPI002FF4369F